MAGIGIDHRNLITNRTRGQPEMNDAFELNTDRKYSDVKDLDLQVPGARCFFRISKYHEIS
jgi:hypothetical protein